MAVVGAGILVGLAAAVLGAAAPTPGAGPERPDSAATGRSGTASLSGEAWRGADGTTWLTLVPGSPEGSPEGAIVRTQVKGMSAQGKLLFTDVRSHEGEGAVRLDYWGLERDTVLQVQALVREVDGRRTDVVTLSVPVKVRPDLQVRLSGPLEVEANTPQAYTAHVSEGNWSVGASAECVLLLGHEWEELQRVPVVVGAGGSAQCAFASVSFPTPGREYLLTVTLDDVSPEDWDETNNYAALVVKVRPRPVSPLVYGVDVREFARVDASEGMGGEAPRTEFRREQSAALWAWTVRALAFPMRLRVVLRAGERALLTWQGEVQAQEVTAGSTCGRFGSVDSPPWGQVCVSRSGASELTTLSFRGLSKRRDAYPAADLSDAWWQKTPCVGSHWSRSVSPQMELEAPAYTFDFTLEAPGVTYAHSLALPLRESKWTAPAASEGCSATAAGGALSCKRTRWLEMERYAEYSGSCR